MGSCNIPLIDHVLPISMWSRIDGMTYEPSGETFYSEREKDIAKKSRALQLNTFWHLDDKIKSLISTDDANEDRENSGGTSIGRGDAKGGSKDISGGTAGG